MSSKIMPSIFFIGIIFLISPIHTIAADISKIKKSADSLNISSSDSLKASKKDTVAYKKMVKDLEKKYLKKYPLGFQLLSVTEMDTILPNNSILRTDYTMDWDHAMIQDSTTFFNIRLPAFVNKYHVSFHDNYFKTDIEKGAIQWAMLDELLITVEMIDYKKYGYNCIVGFSINSHIPRPKN